MYCTRTPSGACLTGELPMRRPHRRFAVTFACALLFATVPTVFAQKDAQFTDLPITRAVLFSSGVGYFEHEGEIEDIATVRLLFKTEQINDVLKSMVLMDEDGTVASVTYASDEPIDRALQSFGVDISGNPSLADLLNQLRGAEITADSTKGKILSVESHDKVVGTPPAKVTSHTLRVLTTAGIKSFDLSAVKSLMLNDKKLQAELNEALSLLIGSRNTDRKPVDVRFVGKARRKVRIGYLVESPVWKTSYRLDLTDKPLLQGWAIVENTSDNDWQKLSLSLISGRPISFIQDLYTPLYLKRPVVQQERFASLRPRLYEEGKDKELSQLASFGAPSNRYAGRPGQNATRALDVLKNKSLKSALGDSKSGWADKGSGGMAVASAGSVGELFAFAIKHPVTLQRRRSAMLPIVQGEVKAEKVSIYNQYVQAKHPLNGVYLTNSTKIKLMAGPITVFDAGTYAGDAQIGHMAPNDKRLLSYAVDLNVTIDPSTRSASKLTAAKIVKGVLHVTHLNTYSQDYAIKNKAAVARTLIVEHPFHSNRKLMSPESFEEKTNALYRFRVPVKAAQAGKFTVEEQQTTSQTVALLNTNTSTFIRYTKQGEISDAVKDALTKAAKLKQDLTDRQNALKQLTGQKSTLEKGQARIRENIKAVGVESVFGKRLVEKLNTQETQLEELDTQIKKAQDAVAAANKALGDYLNGLNVDA